MDKRRLQYSLRSALLIVVPVAVTCAVLADGETMWWLPLGCWLAGVYFGYRASGRKVRRVTMGMSVLFSILPWGIGGYVCYPGSGLGLPSLDLFSDHPVMLPFSWVAWVLFEIGELPLSVLGLLSPTAYMLFYFPGAPEVVRPFMVIYFWVATTLVMATSEFWSGKERKGKEEAFAGRPDD